MKSCPVSWWCTVMERSPTATEKNAGRPCAGEDRPSSGGLLRLSSRRRQPMPYCTDALITSESEPAEPVGVSPSPWHRPEGTELDSPRAVDPTSTPGPRAALDDPRARAHVPDLNAAVELDVVHDRTTTRCGNPLCITCSTRAAHRPIP